jgi:hypothetical protein
MQRIEYELEPVDPGLCTGVMTLQSRLAAVGLAFVCLIAVMAAL